ncbi:MAG: phosphopentomutase [Oscillospiraceae bacterium]|nr:phosphopentomutase [Oscillospiraceae bacterium]
MKSERVFLIVLDSVGIGEMPDAKNYGDEGSNTLKACYDTGRLSVPNMERLGLFNIDGIDYAKPCENPIGVYARMTEKSKGKDTTTGHWEMMGIILSEPFPTYPDGFPEEIISEFEKRTGRKVICNKTYSGTEVIKDYGEEHMKTGALIVYTSADSVFQIAAHEDVVPIETLYEYCEIAREILTGKHAVGRVIARPFEAEHPFKRTSRRHDFSLKPIEKTALSYISEQGLETIGIGKIYDIFAADGITKAIRKIGNDIDMEETLKIQSEDFKGFCFVNLVDFDMSFGHRNDVDGYTNALNEFDLWLGKFIQNMRDDDLLMITADHGCDPVTESTDHSREYTPLLVYRKGIKAKNLGTRESFSDIGKTICACLSVENELVGKDFSGDIYD